MDTAIKSLCYLCKKSTSCCLPWCIKKLEVVKVGEVGGEELYVCASCLQNQMKIMKDLAGRKESPFGALFLQSLVAMAESSDEEKE